ncbi:hypothetical protein GBAR_LOCUS152, partial [Geodia barretti]
HLPNGRRRIFLATVSPLSGATPTENRTNWTVRYPGRRLSGDVFLKSASLPRTADFFFTVPSIPWERGALSCCPYSYSISLFCGTSDKGP